MTRPARRRCRGERGVAGILVLSLTAVLALVGAVSATLAVVAVARQRAAAAADLSALAAAERSTLGPAAACDHARAVAGAAGARLLRCSVRGDVAEVVAEVRPPGRLGMLGAATARARAGSVSEAGSAAGGPSVAGAGGPLRAGHPLRDGRTTPPGQGGAQRAQPSSCSWEKEATTLT